VVMANGSQKALAIADEITDDIIDDGIYNSMKKHGLI
jgi:hydroxymethylpyrimidine pyrophosphatase-like HAD family hydrolase